MEQEYSDYIVYVDESGDHGLKSIDQNYPVFVLAFCIFRKVDYIENLVPALQQFKFKHFGHDQAILHETDIRRDRGEFAFLKSPEIKDQFHAELSNIVAETPFTLIASVIHKTKYLKRYQSHENPYHVALGFGLERVFYFLRDHQAHASLTHIVVEKRGKQEDNDLELEFRRICDGGNYKNDQLPFRMIFADKKSNSAGLQLADLVARPIGLNTIRPEQNNHAYEVLKVKFRGSETGNIIGCGLKTFP